MRISKEREGLPAHACKKGKNEPKMVKKAKITINNSTNQEGTHLKRVEDNVVYEGQEEKRRSRCSCLQKWSKMMQKWAKNAEIYRRHEDTPVICIEHFPKSPLSRHVFCKGYVVEKTRMHLNGINTIAQKRVNKANQKRWRKPLLEENKHQRHQTTLQESIRAAECIVCSRTS